MRWILQLKFEKIVKHLVKTTKKLHKTECHSPLPRRSVIHPFDPLLFWTIIVTTHAVHTVRTLWLPDFLGYWEISWRISYNCQLLSLFHYRCANYWTNWKHILWHSSFLMLRNQANSLYKPSNWEISNKGNGYLPYHRVMLVPFSLTGWSPFVAHLGLQPVKSLLFLSFPFFFFFLIPHAHLITPLLCSLHCPSISSPLWSFISQQNTNQTTTLRWAEHASWYYYYYICTTFCPLPR